MTVDLRIERRIDQTPEACFDLWAQPHEVAQWWGPKDEAGRPFRAKIEAWSASPGEAWSIIMTSPDGAEYFQCGKILEVKRPHLLRFSFAWVEAGQRGPETEIRVEFQPEGSGTRLIFEQIGFSDETTRDGHVEGWKECLDRFAQQCAYGLNAET